jgi:integrase
VTALVEQYRAEKMPQRFSTRRGYEADLRHRILPRWGAESITDVQARPVELWLQSLTPAPKTKAEIRGLLRIVWEFAMWRGDVPTQRNPMELVTVKGASKRQRKPRSLTVAEFQRFIVHLNEPFRTMALVCVCFGLRISECMALKWSDVDWLNSKLSVQRGIVKQHVDDVKTVGSEQAMTIDAGMVQVLKLWRQTSQFSASEDWMFASPAKIGRQPWSYDQVLRAFVNAGTDAGIGKLGTHSMRHSYRSWLDAVGTPIAVQQKLMRHADIRTTMNVYGDIVTDEMAVASGKITRLALNGLPE